jgi:hypothetical protein
MNSLKEISPMAYKSGMSSWWGWIKYSDSRFLARKYIKKEILETMRYK